MRWKPVFIAFYRMRRKRFHLIRFTSFSTFPSKGKAFVLYDGTLCDIHRIVDGAMDLGAAGHVDVLVYD